MPLRQLKNIYEKRKNTLVELLKKDSKIDKSRKDQLIGAISEIDTLLKTIENLREQEIQDNRSLEIMGLDFKKLNPMNIPLLKNINEKMKMRFEQSKTRHNLINLFIRKCETRTKYQLFAKYAKLEGFEHIAKAFNDIAEQELEHARIIYKFLNMERTTPENIKESANIEQSYHDKIYAQFEDVAKQESFMEIAEFLKEITEIEAEHEKIFLKLLRLFHEKRIFKSENIVRWKCKSCGFILESREAPRKCKICAASQGHFSIVHE